MAGRRTVAVLGASGFIGSCLVDSLVLGDLATVRPIVRSFRGMARSSRFNLDCRVADATDREALSAELRGCDVLFQCVVGDHGTIMKSAATAYRAAAQAGVRRLVYLSSAVVHGNCPAPGTREDSELIAAQPFEYNVSKVMAERLLRRLGRDRAVEIVTLRPFIVFGPRSTYWTVRIARDLLKGTAYLVNGGAGVCNTVHVDNLVRAMWLAAVSDRAANEAFIITDGVRVTWHDLYSAVADAVGVDMAQIYDLSEAQLERMVKPRIGLWKSVVRHAGQAAKQTLPPVAITIARRNLPARVKKALRRRWEAAHDAVNGDGNRRDGAWRGPTVDPFLANLQTCKVVLPVDKAREVLGYQPLVSFAEGCRRTSEWLRYVHGGSLVEGSDHRALR